MLVGDPSPKFQFHKAILSGAITDEVSVNEKALPKQTDGERKPAMGATPFIFISIVSLAVHPILF